MNATCSFKFVDDTLNAQLLDLLTESKARHTVDRDGAVNYSRDDEELIGNDLISSIRNRLFTSWQIVHCPPDWADSYTEYMNEHNIRFFEEVIDGRLCFLVSRRNQPHRWKLKEPQASLPAKVNR